MLAKLVEDVAAHSVSRKESLLAAGVRDVLPLQVDFWRAGNEVASIRPHTETLPTLAKALRVGAAGFEADIALIAHEVWVVPQDAHTDVHPVTGEPLRDGDIDILLADNGYQRGLVKPGVLAVGGNRAGDVVVVVDLYRHLAPGCTIWDRAPQHNLDQIRDGRVGDLVRAAMLHPSVQQVGSRQFPLVTDTDTFPQERLDCMTAGFLHHEHGCDVQLLAQPEEKARAEGLRRWGSEDWHWAW